MAKKERVSRVVPHPVWRARWVAVGSQSSETKRRLERFKFESESEL
jgi:hypothetical protein